MQPDAGKLADLDSLRNVDQDEYRAWFHERGAAIPNQASIQLALQGDAEDTVVIADIDLEKTCRAPIYGTLFFLPGQAENPTIPLSFDLDQPVSRALEPESGKHYFSQKTISLQPGEREVLSLGVETKRQYCEFGVRLHIITVDGDSVIQEDVA